jgi:hypothetical protein
MTTPNKNGGARRKAKFADTRWIPEHRAHALRTFRLNTPLRLKRTKSSSVLFWAKDAQNVMIKVKTPVDMPIGTY